MSARPRAFHERVRDAAQWLLRRLAEVTLAGLALLTLVDVLGRYVFSVPVRGAVEMTELLMVGVIFSGIVLATQRREHVVVDLLALPQRSGLRRLQQGAGIALATAISGLLGAVTWSRALSALDFGERTTILGVPLAPMVFFMSAMLWLNALVNAAHLWEIARGGPVELARPSTDPEESTP
jgi:TRAP-type C4-dicarboxylate transport system permease small subunit